MNKSIWLKIAALATLGWSSRAQSDAPGMKERADMRNLRYCEVLVVMRHGMSATASVYNTVGLNDCPDDKWKALDAEKIKAERKAFMVILNGPRYFMMDRNALKKPAGGVESFGGVQMRELATLEMKPGHKREPYTENTVDRESQYVYEAGKNVYELIAPLGRSYIMQSYSIEKDPGLTEAELSNLGSKLKLPKGWRFQVRKLTQEMVVRNSGTQAYVLQDDLQNSYQRLN
jgi:hypothetical protein